MIAWMHERERQRGLLAQAIRWIDRWLVPRDWDPDERWRELLRARTLIAIVLALPLPLALYFVANRMVGKPLDSVELGAFLSSSTLLLLLPLIRSGKLRVAGNLAVGFGMVLAVGAAATSGGEATPPLLLAVIFPLVAVFLVGIRAGLVWTGVAVVSILGLWAAVGAGVEFPRSIAPEVQLRHRFAAPLLQLALLTLLGFAYEHFRRRSQHERELSLARLARNERQFRAVFDESAVGIALLDAEGRVVAINRYGRDFLPLCIGDGFVERVLVWSAADPPESVGADPEADVLQRLEKGLHEFCVEGPSGECEWASGSLSYVRDERGEVEIGIAVLRRVTEQRLAQDQMRRMAYFDSLTGLPNRAFFWERLRQAVQACREGDDSVGLIFVDLDGFKDINDLHGHQAGDAVLSTTAQRLKQSVRGADEIISSQSLMEWNGVSRLGGDEFTVLLGKVDGRAGAKVVCERILAAVCQPIPWRGTMVRVGASLGVALLPEHTDDEEDLLRLADRAMYEEKRSGRCGYRFA